MKGHQQVIDVLNKLLTGELSAMDQYFVHAHMYEDWGLNELYERIKHESDDEREHAAKLIARILFLEGTPDVASRDALTIGKNVQEMLHNDLQYEYKVAANLREAITLCEQLKDYQSRELLELLLEETEDDHMYWLEKQLGLIGKVGLQNYIQSKM
ncbi:MULTISPECIES: bacterioferritin [Shewanella]|jgi:bacterioferritin|uniref:Bacterioferritin n=2 Tax=Shewanella TaxID=22 RepID=A0A6G7LPQ3_9GAMM|nr:MULTISPECIES: bacterioferritin [Shewanella]OIN17371.1 bacterioferritin [Shewanella algae]MBZ4679482.1 bacterioferritin [Shewanella sp.]MCA0950819.1 bacterioferritin [Shewanella chilikensis]MCE9792648.1 bacterioferritin [Shewanella indica]MCE9852448.1 bacterioferritin [Shewanella chilikensis]